MYETIESYYLVMNGKFKIKNGTLIELIIYIILNSGDTSYWWDAIFFNVCYVLNKVLESKTNVVPYEIIKKKIN